MGRFKWALIAVVAIACAKEHKKPEETQEAIRGDLPDAASVSEWDDSRARAQLLSHFVTNGYVHTRRHGEADDIGDAGTFTGIAMAALDCEEGRPLFDAVLGNIKLNNGLLTRFEPKPSPDDLSSRDVVVGTLFGLSVRARRCPSDKEKIAEVWPLHRAYVLALGGKLYPGAGPDKSMTDNLQWLWDEMSRYLGVPVDGPGKGKFEVALTATTTAIREQKAACYPIHLQTLQALTAYALGSPISSFARLSFCTAAKGTQLALTEWYCERGGWRDFFNAPVRVKYEHQRCPRWEDENLDGVEVNDLDRILMKRLAERAIM